MIKILATTFVFVSVCSTSYAEIDQNKIKFWIGSQEVVVGKNWYGSSIKEKPDVSRIGNLKQKKLNCEGALILDCIEKYEFTYMYKNNNLNCNTTMTYTKTRTKDNQALKLIITDCN